MTEPRYQELKAKDIPHVTKDGVTAIVIAGEALGVKVRNRMFCSLWLPFFMHLLARVDLAFLSCAALLLC